MHTYTYIYDRVRREEELDEILHVRAVLRVQAVYAYIYIYILCIHIIYTHVHVYIYICYTIR